MMEMHFHVSGWLVVRWWLYKNLSVCVCGVLVCVCRSKGGGAWCVVCGGCGWLVAIVL